MSLGILCPGQGDQSIQMFDILQGVDQSQQVLKEACGALGKDPTQISADMFHINAVAQPLVCSVQLAIWAGLRDHLPTPGAIAGYSVGELIAHGCADALPLNEVLHLATKRAKFMDQAYAEPTGMLAVRGIIFEQMQRLCTPFGLEIAIVNDADRLVIGGRRSDLLAFEPVAMEHGAKVTPLKITIASHTSFMASAVVPFRSALEQCALSEDMIPVLAGGTGSIIRNREEAMQSLSEQLAGRVNWAACLDSLDEIGCTIMLELGPGNGLTRMVRDRFPNIDVRSVSEFRTLQGVVDWVARMI